MTNINTYFGVSSTTSTQSNRTTNTENNLFSTELLLSLIANDVVEETPTTSYYSLENSGDSIVSFTEGDTPKFSLNSNGKFTTTIDWSCYEKSLSDAQIDTLSRQYGGELTLEEYAEAMKAIARLESAKIEEDEILDEMSERIVYGEADLDTPEVVTMQSKYSAEFMDNLSFFDIDKNTEFYNSDANIFDEFKLSLENKNYDYVNFFSLLGEKGSDDKFKLALEGDELTTQIGENAKDVSFEENSPLNLNKYGGFSHLTPLIVQDIKSDIENMKNNKEVS